MTLNSTSDFTVKETEDINIKNIMDGKVDDIPTHERIKQIKQGFCVECEDQPTQVFCEQCDDDYCQVCFLNQHRKGNRKKHTVKNFALQETVQHDVVTKTAEEYISSVDLDVVVQADQFYMERARYIPLRLTLEERKYLRLLEAGLNVSEYTDKIDVLVYSSKTKRIVHQIKELCSILSGLVLAADYSEGQKLFQDRDFQKNQSFFQKIFELGRRHKIMNPEKMRSTYGKLIYMLQDSQIPEVRELLEFDCVSPVKTVYETLEKAGGLNVLKDELVGVATLEITTEGKTRQHIQSEIRQKERAIEVLARKYQTNELDSETIRQCLYSIGDNHAFLRCNRDPCEKMIIYLKTMFSPDSGPSLSIMAGREGARLSHGHSKQYQYVMQSLCLWREVLNEMFMLWIFAEEDLLEKENYYRLRDTGQGLNRVQAAPRISRMMHTILNRAQQKVGSWVGSSVIHLGDHNVPNALMFIDKYTQIYRILLPVVNTLEKLADIKDPKVLLYIQNAFGSIENARLMILQDFFRHAFDGSGADNFFDAGSCIDGRLTSAWNWCSQLEKKPYFPLFLLTGFMGFDGQF